MKMTRRLAQAWRAGASAWRAPSLLRMILIPNIATIVLIVAGVYVALNYTLKDLEDRWVQNDAESVMEDIKASLNTLQKQNLQLAALLSADPTVREAYGLALTGNIDAPDDPLVAKARAQLRGYFEPYRQNLQYFSMDKRPLYLHFHLPNNRSLLRVWRDRQTLSGQDISDDLSGFRATVSAINDRSLDRIAGLEIGRGRLRDSRPGGGQGPRRRASRIRRGLFRVR